MPLSLEQGAAGGGGAYRPEFAPVVDRPRNLAGLIPAKLCILHETGQFAGTAHGRRPR
jgi:hypothetical protein